MKPLVVWSFVSPQGFGSVSHAGEKKKKTAVMIDAWKALTVFVLVNLSNPHRNNLWNQTGKWKVQFVFAAWQSGGQGAALSLSSCVTDF